MNACYDRHNIENKVSQRDKKKMRIQITNQTDVENEKIIQTSLNTPSSSLKRQTDILNYVKKQQRFVQVSKFNQISQDQEEFWLTDINTQEYLYKLPEVKPFFEGRTQLKLIQQSQKNKDRIIKILQHLKDSSFSIHSNQQFVNSSKPLRQNSVHFDFSIADQQSLQTEQMIFSPLHKRRSTTTPKQKKTYDPLSLQLQIHNFTKIKQTNKQIINDKETEAKEIVQKSELYRKETLQEKRNLINYQQFKNTQREQYSLRTQLNQSLNERMNKSHQQREGFIRLLEKLQKQTYLNIDKMIIDQLDRIRQLLMIGKPIKGENIFLNKSLKITKMIMQQLKIG